MNEPLLEEYQQKMDKAVEATHRDLRAIRTGRANPAILDSIKVDYYNTPTPLNQMATISVPEPRMIIIQPWDKSAIENIVKSIQQSDLGISPNSDGTVIRLPFPKLTEDRRKELVKVSKSLAEEGKVSLRNIRREANEMLKKAEKSGELSEDESKRLQDIVQNYTDEHSKKLDSFVEDKVGEIMEV